MSHQKLLISLATLIVIVLVVVAGLSWLKTRRAEQTAPVLPQSGTGDKWRIAYYQGGDYIDYANNLRAMIPALVALGWMDPLDIPVFDDPEDAGSIWAYLAGHAQSSYLEFASDAFWSADWDDAYRADLSAAVIQRLHDQHDIDLVIAMGTWAGQDLANDRHSVPTMVLTSSDPIEAGIIKSAGDSGYDHVIVEVDPERYMRQIRLFHDIVGFDRLGVVYEDSPDGRVFANLADLERVAGERGFTLVTCFANDTRVSEAQARSELAACYEELAPEIDALWLTAHRAEQSQYMPDILAPMFESHVATWAQNDSEAVKRGALMSIQPIDFAAAGQWYAGTMARILNGARPRDLNQVFEMPDHIIINLETARRIGFEVPKGILSIADETYESIEGE